MELAPPRISRLPPQLANQIAAGEVVERPASVVKELVENSIDAGAHEIVIEIEGGGIRLLRVRDDGVGIHRDDLALALSRHATSKIQHARDLLGIVSLGFRGEALASIASVARVRLVSRTRDSETAWAVDGNGKQPAPAPHPAGTTIEVRDLFYNVPARRKFLRAERTEYEHLENVARRLALGNFNTGLILRNNGRTVFSVTPAATVAEQERRLIALVGRPFLEQALAIEFEAAGLRLRGWIGSRGYTRSQADVQYVYINGRSVRDRVLAHALRQAFDNPSQEGRFPAYVLYLEMDPAQVDVNVHPTKHEVRFREARLVHDFLVSALRSALGEAQWLPPPLKASEVITEPEFPYETSVRGGPSVIRSGDESLLGVIGERFLLAQGALGLIVVDALRLVQDEARAGMATERTKGALGQKPLLIPAVVKVGAAGVQGAESCRERLKKWGIEIEALSGESVRLLSVPDVAFKFDAQALVSGILEGCVACWDEERLLGVLARAVEVPKSAHERAALLSRASEAFRIELDPNRLARLVSEGG